MIPISKDKRDLLIAAKQRREKNGDIAKWLKITDGSVAVIRRLYQKTVSVEPKTYKGRPTRLSGEMIEKIYKKVEPQPDATLAEIIEVLNLPIRLLCLYLVELLYVRRRV
jgi:transposase